jgi:hypothetical protein
MATLYATEASGYLNTVPPTLANGAVHDARVRRFRAKITLATQTTSDTIVLAKIPAGYHFAYGVLTSSVSLGSSTVAIGISGTTGKYRTAATFTAVDTPTLFGCAASVMDDDPLTAAETVYITIAAASLPASGTLVVDLYFSGT